MTRAISEVAEREYAPFTRTLRAREAVDDVFRAFLYLDDYDDPDMDRSTRVSVCQHAKRRIESAIETLQRLSVRLDDELILSRTWWETIPWGRETFNGDTVVVRQHGSRGGVEV